MTKKTKKFALYFSTGVIILAGGIKVKLCKEGSRHFTHKVISYITDFTDDDFQIAAHRGFSSLEIENTMDAVVLANSKEYIDYIEIDLRLTKDNKLVLSHNNCLQTLQNKNVKISNKSLKSLQKYEYRYPNNPITTIQNDADDINSEIMIKRKKKLINQTYKLTTLDECLDESITKKIILDLKFKNNTDEYIAELEKEVSGIDLENVIFQSHDFKSLLKLKEMHPEYNIAAIIKNIDDFKYIESFDNLCIKNSLINEELINSIVNDNKCLFVWTLNSPSELSDLTDKLGDNYEDVIYITDYPDIIATCLHEKQKQLKKEKTNH